MHSCSYQYRIDPLLTQDIKKNLESLLKSFNKDDRIDNLATPCRQGFITVDFLSEASSIIKNSHHSFRICYLDNRQTSIFLNQEKEVNISDLSVDAIVDFPLTRKYLEKVIFPLLGDIIQSRSMALLEVGKNNLKQFETRMRQLLRKDISGVLPLDSLLDFLQKLSDLERELIQAENLSRFEKKINVFYRTNIGERKCEFINNNNLFLKDSTHNFLLLPSYRGEFIGLEINWNEDDPLKLTKKFFFYFTLIKFFQFQQNIKVPFFDELLWDQVLDSIPFPVVLFSQDGEIHQHNSVFSRLGVTPERCLKLKLKEKIIINNIPYNIFRTDFHLGNSQKIFFVFFTESIFLKSDENLTPTGQELGIISSSIAHELNNPIAGIQAALSVLLLEENLNNEDFETLQEMKNGAHRCKQLVETFLGFSRANPSNSLVESSSLGPIDLCYQQAQNLLRFRTVESGIRFKFSFTKHAFFQAQVNPSLLTMTFYLLLGELMTLYSHQLLIAEKNHIEKIIRGEIIESSQEIQIQLHELNISSLTLTKLIQNLLTIEKFVLQVSDYSLRFIYNP